MGRGVDGPGPTPQGPLAPLSPPDARAHASNVPHPRTLTLPRKRKFLDGIGGSEGLPGRLLPSRVRGRRSGARFCLFPCDRPPSAASPSSQTSVARPPVALGRILSNPEVDEKNKLLIVALFFRYCPAQMRVNKFLPRSCREEVEKKKGCSPRSQRLGFRSINSSAECLIFRRSKSIYHAHTHTRTPTRMQTRTQNLLCILKIHK